MVFSLKYRDPDYIYQERGKTHSEQDGVSKQDGETRKHQSVPVDPATRLVKHEAETVTV